MEYKTQAQTLKAYSLVEEIRPRKIASNLRYTRYTRRKSTWLDLYLGRCIDFWKREKLHEVGPMITGKVRDAGKSHTSCIVYCKDQLGKD